MISEHTYCSIPSNQTIYSTIILKLIYLKELDMLFAISYDDSRGVHRIFERGRRGVGAKRRLRGHRDRREQGPGGAAPRKFLTKLYAKPIGYQYRRFKAVDNTLGH